MLMFLEFTEPLKAMETIAKKHNLELIVCISNSVGDTRVIHVNTELQFVNRVDTTRLCIVSKMAYPN
jgi:hypothetical protein